MDRHRDTTKKQLTKSKQTVDLKKALQIVEGGFNTQEMNSAFDFNEYDILSYESLCSEITSSDENQSNTEDEDPVIIVPSPKRRKSNNFDKICHQLLLSGETQYQSKPELLPG